MKWDGVVEIVSLDKVGRTASIAGSETDGLGVIDGRSVDLTIGVPGGLVSGAGLGGRDRMAGRVTRPSTGKRVISCRM